MQSRPKDSCIPRSLIWISGNSPWHQQQWQLYSRQRPRIQNVEYRRNAVNHRHRCGRGSSGVIKHRLIVVLVRVVSCLVLRQSLAAAPPPQAPVRSLRIDGERTAQGCLQDRCSRALVGRDLESTCRRAGELRKQINPGMRI